MRLLLLLLLGLPLLSLLQQQAVLAVSSAASQFPAESPQHPESAEPRILQFGRTQHLPPVVWRAPIGCDSTGFFMEILAFFTGLVPFFKSGKLFLDVGRCSHYTAFTDKETKMLTTLQNSFLNDPPEWQDSIVIHHKLPGQAVPPQLSRSAHLIGRLMSETNIISRKELQQIKIFDEIWVPTNFHADVFERHGVPSSKLHVIPEAVDVQFYSAIPKPFRRKVFRFFSVFKYEKRKGPDILLSAYWQSFKKDDNVELVIRSYKPSWEMGPADLEKVFDDFALKTFGKPMSALAPVVWLKEEVTKEELRSLYLSADVFVLPTRGEGWCLPCAEALATGTPIIVTNYSGPSAFLSYDHSFPLNIKHTLNFDGTAEPDETHLSQLMRNVTLMEHDDLVSMGRNAKKFASQYFEPSVVALHIIKRLNAIHSNILTISHVEL